MDELDALYAFLTAMVSAAALTPFVAAARRAPSGRSTSRASAALSDEPTPLLGGLAIFAGVLVAGADLAAGRRRRRRAILAGAAVITVVGAVDDIFDLPPPGKLAGQFAAALIPVLSGVRVDHITLPFLGAHDLGDLGGPLTMLGIVAVMNVVNFTDGARRPGGGRLRDQRGDVRDDRASTWTATRRACWRRSRPARRSASSSTTSTRRRSSWATRARTCSAICSPCIASRAR